jgi:oligo-1,6-glucosidase
VAQQRKWWKEAVVYQIYPRSFADSNGDGIGDLNGITARMEYLKSLGAGMVWLSPVFGSPNDDMGYDISDYRAIMTEFGTMEDFDRMLASAHRNGIRMLLDLVVNHTSDEHPWFAASRSSKTGPYRDFYHWHAPRDGREPNNWKSFFGGSVWEYDTAGGEYYLHLFSRKQPDLNWNNPRVREEIFDMMRFWLDKGVDGFRMDVINFLAKAPGFPDHPVPPGFRDKYIFAARLYMNQPGIHEMLSEMNEKVLGRYDMVSVGECHEITAGIAGDYVNAGRREIDMLFLFEVMGAGRDLVKLKRALRGYYEALRDDGWFAVTLNNHDSRRQVSRIGDDGRFREESAKCLAAFLMTAPGTPFLFQGEEIGMTDVRFGSIGEYRDIETQNRFRELCGSGMGAERALDEAAKGSRDNARTPMQWDGSANGGFSRAAPWIGANPNHTSVNVRSQEDDPRSILNFYRTMIRFRRQTPCMAYGDFSLVGEDDAQVYSCVRALDGGAYLTVLNFSGERAQFSLPPHMKERSLRPLISNYPDMPASPCGGLRPWEAWIGEIGA